MKTLSIRQPYATLIAEGIKDIENRSFKTNFRGTFLIHASMQWHDRAKHNELFTHDQFSKIIDHTSNQMIDIDSPDMSFFKYKDPKHIKPLVVSAIIGQVDLVDCVINHDSIWAEKLKDQVLGEFYEKQIYNFVLENAILYHEPILNVKGKLYFWEYDIDKLNI